MQEERHLADEPLAATVASSDMAEAWNLRGSSFWDAGVFDAEMEAIFSKMWLALARSEDLSRPGDFVSRELAGESIVLLRGEDRVVRAFFNVCRHRGTRLVAVEQGKDLRKIVCPYHAWVYGCDGRLLAAPRMEESSSFCKDDFGLVPVRCSERHGFVFASLDDDGPDLEVALADFPNVGAYGLGNLRRGALKTYEVAANWKILCQNYSECYHCSHVHHHLHRLSDGSGPRGPVEGDCFNGGPMWLKPGFSSMTLDGSTTRRPLPGLAEDDLRVVQYYVIYPNLLLSLHPDYALIHTVWPLDEGRSRVRCEWLFAEDEISRSGFDPGDAVEFWDLTNRQDWELCETVQKGVRSRGHRPGRYQASEDCVYFFDRWYRKQVGSKEPP